MKRYFATALLCAASLAFLTGGGDGKNEVEINGAATLDGAPIDLGIVQFTNGTAEGGGNVQDGSYTAKVPPGELTVRVRGYRYTGPEPEIPEPQPGVPPSAPPQRPREPMTPESMWQNPTFKITVKKGGTYDLNFVSEEAE